MLDGTGGWESEIAAAERADGARLEGAESPMEAAADSVGVPTARVPLYETAPSKRRERVAIRADGSEEGAVAAGIFERAAPVLTSDDAADSWVAAGVPAATAPAAMTATDFAAAGKETGLKERGVTGMAGV